MAGNKTPDSPSNGDKKTDETRQDAETAPANETAPGKDDDARTAPPAGTGEDEPETVDAEVVEDGKTFESTDSETSAADTPPPDEGRTAADRTDGKKGAGIGFGAVLAVLLLVGAVLIYFVATGGDETELAETTPGVVRGEAEPFPPNELDDDTAPDEGPIEAEAAPGAREAAMAADEDGDGAGLSGETEEETLRAEAAERAQARREAREADMASAGDDEAAADESAADETAADMSGEDVPAEADSGNTGMAARLAAARAAQRPENASADETEAPAASGEGEVQDAETAEAISMAERLAAARAAQTREDAEASGETVPSTEATQAPAEEGAAEEEMAAPEEDDPNAMSEFLRPRGEDEAADSAPEAAPVSREPAEPAEEAAAEAPSATRPTGQIDREETEGEPQAATPLRRPRGETRAEEDVAPAQDDSVAAEEEAQAPEPSPMPAPVPATPAPAEPEESEAAERPQPIEPRPAPARTGPDLDEELDQRLDAVRADVRQDVLAEAEQRIEAAIRETEAEVRRLRAELTEQEARSNARIAQLQDRLEVLQSRNAADTQQGVLILALSSLGSEIDQGRPFTRQIEDIGRLAPNVRSLDFARSYAATGLPTDEQLREDFQAAAREAQSAARREGAEGFEKLWANLTGLFTVRPAGPVEGDTPSAVISRAEAALETGDLAAAVDELRMLDGEARAAFEPWMETASAKAQIRERIDALERAVLARAG